MIAAKPNQNPTFIKLQQMLADITGNETVDIFPDSSIYDDLNMTPLELAQFLASIKHEFPGVELHREDLEDLETIADIAAYVEDILS